MAVRLNKLPVDWDTMEEPFSPDGSQIIFRASRPTSEQDVKEYKDLLAEGLVQPTKMELHICNADGTNLRKLTDLGNANWAPFSILPAKGDIFLQSQIKKRISV